MSEQTGWQYTSDLMARIAQLETQLREADVTATAMGLAYSEIKQENERLREVLEDICSVDIPLPYGLRTQAEAALANHFGDANKMVSDGKEGA